MNKEERKFYEYLISLPETVFDNWLATAPDEALELADRLFDEVKFKHLDRVTDLTEASDLLKKFTLNG